MGKIRLECHECKHTTPTDECLRLAHGMACVYSATPESAAAGAMLQSAFSKQVGGSHYRDMAIQPVEYIHKNGLRFVEGAVIKYVSRWRAKNGVEDLKKARHLLDLLIEMEESAG